MLSNTSLFTRFGYDWQSLCQKTPWKSLPEIWPALLPVHAKPPSSSIRLSNPLADIYDLVCQRDDSVTAALIRLARAGEQLAGRVILQSILPKLMSISRRDYRHSFDDYLSYAWETIVCFPIDDRNQALLVNLSLDCLKKLSRASASALREVPSIWLSQPETDVSSQPMWYQDQASTSKSTVDALLAWVDGAGLVPKASLAAIRSVYSDGLSSREAALVHGSNPEMVRYRCSSAIKKLRAHRQELIAALG